MCFNLLEVWRRYPQLAADGASREHLAGFLEQDQYQIENTGIHFGYRYSTSPSEARSPVLKFRYETPGGFRRRALLAGEADGRGAEPRPCRPAAARQCPRRAPRRCRADSSPAPGGTRSCARLLGLGRPRVDMVGCEGTSSYLLSHPITCCYFIVCPIDAGPRGSDASRRRVMTRSGGHGPRIARCLLAWIRTSPRLGFRLTYRVIRFIPALGYAVRLGFSRVTPSRGGCPAAAAPGGRGRRPLAPFRGKQA